VKTGNPRHTTAVAGFNKATYSTLQQSCDTSENTSNQQQLSGAEPLNILVVMTGTNLQREKICAS
jgi:hypothetical protein